MIRRLKYALHGLMVGIKHDRSIRLHIIVGVVVFIASFFVCLSSLDWAVLILTIFFVIAMEYVNSAIESFADRVHPEQHLAIKKTKDLAAAAVLLASICAVLVGLFIFIPPLLNKTAGYCLTNLSDGN
ncbi:MAG: diacylglycerol kinase family protein [bacterium]|nr:diacylglycerol kinase family protein [bacterium]